MEPLEEKSYLKSTLIAAGIFGLIGTVLNIGMFNWMASGEPSTFKFLMMSGGSMIICLLLGLAGFVAVWNFVKSEGGQVNTGKGAVIGLVTGIFLAVIMTLLGILYEVFDPTMLDRVADAMAGGMQTMLEGQPEEVVEESINQIYESFDGQKTLAGRAIGFLTNTLSFAMVN